MLKVSLHGQYVFTFSMSFTVQYRNKVVGIRVTVETEVEGTMVMVSQPVDVTKVTE